VCDDEGRKEGKKVEDTNDSNNQAKSFLSALLEVAALRPDERAKIRPFEL
jgi:hypothetical protein